MPTIPITKEGANAYRKRFGVWPRGYEPEKPEKLTDRGKALSRIRAGTGDKADSVFVGLQPRAAQPKAPEKLKTLLEQLKDSSALSKEKALDKFITGKQLSPTDSSLVRSYLPKPEKPKEPKKYDPSTALTDSTAALKLRAMSGTLVPGDEKKMARYRGINEAMSVKSGKDKKPGITKQEFFKAMSAHQDAVDGVKNFSGLDSDAGSTGLGMYKLMKKDAKSIIDKYMADQLAQEFDPAEYFAKTMIDETTGFKFVSDGKKWIAK